jgi:lipopolysaccharide/colanic/teichoic acid biosynthesis glycosyltransferase
MRRLAGLALVAGTAGCVLGLSKLHAAVNSYDYTSSSRFGWSLVYVAALCVAAYGFGLPDGAHRRRDAFLRASGATVSALAFVSFAQLLTGDALLPRAVVLGTAVVLVPWYMLCAALAGDARARAEDRDRAVLVGDDDEASVLSCELHRAAERPAALVASISVEDAVCSDPPTRPLVDLVVASEANVLVLDRRAQASDDVVAQAAVLHERGVRVRTLSLFYEQWLGKLPVAELERVSLLFDIGEVHAPGYARVKRMFDVVLGAVGLVVLALLLPVVVVGNLIANRGPLLYRQTRIGRGGREFSMLKLRTMRATATSDPTLERDPRVTPFGGMLRRTHVDELPQVVNILRGELAIVGPRPEQPHLVARLAGKIPFYGIRHLVRPGLTGWAQVKYHYGADDADALEKLQYEVFYLRRQSLGLDLRIVARTLRSVLGMEGR